MIPRPGSNPTIRTASVGIGDTLRLPCGAVLANRIAKTAMTEGLADRYNRATERLSRLYEAWAAARPGLLITGNIMVDRRYLERPGNVAVDRNGGEAELAALACAAGDVPIWMQINHPGRQASPLIPGEPVSPSAVAMRGKPDYHPPRALTIAEIGDIIARFGHVAEVAKRTGFSGVQIHAAHGYLLSTFLSPIANVRKDDWGGSLENRARLLIACVRAARAAVGPRMAVGVKLNSTDFQKGGFSPDECLTVVGWLADEGVDLVELSGGSVEAAAAIGDDIDDVPRASTVAREAYFFDFTREICAGDHRPPIMLTGGLRTRAAMDELLAKGGVDMLGLARPFCVDTRLARTLLTSRDAIARCAERFIPVSSTAATMSWFGQQMRRIGDGLAPDPDLTVDRAIAQYLSIEEAMAADLAGTPANPAPLEPGIAKQQSHG